VRAGQIFRIVALEGPQVADLNVWSLANPRERFWASRSRQLHQAHVSTYDRLWSCLPYLRPMLTIVADTVQYGRDEDGAGCHDLLGTRCDPYVHKLLNGEEWDVCCHSNLVRAVRPYRLTELDVHDVLNVFQVTGLTPEGRYFTKPSPARRGDFIEFFAEIRRAGALSVCPHGDMSKPVWGRAPAMASAICRPLGIEIWQPAPELLRRLDARRRRPDYARRPRACASRGGPAAERDDSGPPRQGRARARRPAHPHHQHARHPGGGHLGFSAGIPPSGWPWRPAAPGS
jgi:uncharacterized protein YcgI (DUF1989 family)